MKLRHVPHVPLALLAVCVLLVPLSSETDLTAAESPRTGPTAGPAPVRVLYPPAGAIVTSNPALIMILGPDRPEPPPFELDGVVLPVKKITFAEAWEMVPTKIPIPAGSDDLPLRSPLLEDKTGNVVWATAEQLSEGEHVVSLDGGTLATFSSRAPKESDVRTWEEPVLRVHGAPGSRAEALDCGQCHRSESSRVLGVAPVPEACHNCHADVDLALAHEHVMEFLAKCQMCHDPHAATGPSLLIDTREVVCSLCHESGHAR
jgi:predicted CXXCH cytochrome family protein